MTYQVEDNDDLEVTGRIIDVLRDARDIYAPPGSLNRSEGWWDGAVDYILYGEGQNGKGSILTSEGLEELFTKDERQNG